MNERLEAVVKGRVQAVMYRDFTCRYTKRFGLTGEVQNLPDGSVRVIAEGPRKTLERFAAVLKRGPLLADVKSVETSWHPATGSFSAFTLRHA